MSTAEADCEVAIVGLGPVGLALAALLGERGVSVVAMDPAVEPVAYPRAIAADDEMLRSILRLPAMSDPQSLFAAGRRVEVRGARGRLITNVAFNESPLGVAGLSFFHQPSLERTMRAALATAPMVEARWGTRLTALKDSARGVRLEFDNAAPLTAQWVVGCDGAASLVRRSRGIGYGGRTFAEPWIVVDIDSPSPLAHLPNFTYVLDRRRPSVNMPRPGGHRFEFMVLAGEDPTAMARRAQVDEWLEPYLAALDQAARRELQILRASGYTYHSRIAARWRDGRVLLAGDAAHCMPPFGGQGLGAGIGDALALAWRLDEVRRDLSPASLLDDYERERRPRVEEMTRTALIAGRLLTATSAPGAAATQAALTAIDSAPVLGRRFRAGSLRAGPRVPAQDHKQPSHGGEPLPNPAIRTWEGRVLRLDDVLPAGWALLGRGADPSRALPTAFLAALRARSCRTLTIVAPGDLPSSVKPACPTVEDLDGTLLALWAGSRWGRGGKSGRLGRWAESDRTTIALVRPDRFLVGVSHPMALADAFARLTHAEWPSPGPGRPR